VKPAPAETPGQSTAAGDATLALLAGPKAKPKAP
jgi:hypothetical protein